MQSYNREFQFRLEHRQRAHADQLTDYRLQERALAEQVTRDMIQHGIDAFALLPTPTLNSSAVIILPGPIYDVGDFVEFQLPGRAFTVYVFGEVRSATLAPLYAIVTPAGNYYTV